MKRQRRRRRRRLPSSKAPWLRLNDRRATALAKRLLRSRTFSPNSRPRKLLPNRRPRGALSKWGAWKRSCRPRKRLRVRPTSRLQPNWQTSRLISRPPSLLPKMRQARPLKRLRSSRLSLLPNKARPWTVPHKLPTTFRAWRRSCKTRTPLWRRRKQRWRGSRLTSRHWRQARAKRRRSSKLKRKTCGQTSRRPKALPKRTLRRLGSSCRPWWRSWR
mmetsp:Transcript_63956/g.125620  ORF Transcript_63956/g.125620 Transcript_63956/m.125620 type:complete len:217 (-) Transcript_63956:404-1054(-)